MKILIATDIHGSAYYAKRLIEKFNENLCEQLILLGDVYNHGPRNPFPRDYAPMQSADALNSVADRLIAVKGNCDSEVDQALSDFPFVSDYVLLCKGFRAYFTHGHVCNKQNPPPTARQGDVVFYGHFHTSEINVVNGVICVNVGSASLPKDGKRAYCILEDGSISLYNLDTDELICDFSR